MGEQTRLFVALSLPQEIREALAGWAAGVAPTGLRLVAQEDLHVTVAFLGSRPQADAEVVAALLPLLAVEPGTLSTAGALWLGPKRPGVLTVALAVTAQLTALHTLVGQVLAAAVGYEPDQRRFQPHVTVGRVGCGERIADAATSEAPPALTFDADALTLYRSSERSDGPRYEPIVFRPFGG